MASVFHRQFELFHTSQELSNLVWFGLPAVVLQVERSSGLWVLVDVVAAPRPVQSIPERLRHLAEIREANIPGPSQHFFIDFARFHRLRAQCASAMDPTSRLGSASFMAKNCPLWIVPSTPWRSLQSAAWQ